MTLPSAPNFIARVFRSFVQDDCLNLAAVISFYAIFSMIPLTMIALALMAYLVGTSLPGVMQEVTGVLSSILPQATAGIMQNITSVMQRKAHLGWMGIAFMVVIASLLFSSLEKALDKVFQSVHRRNFLHSRLVAISLILVVAFLFFIPALIRPAISFFETYSRGMATVLARILTADTFFLILAFLSFSLFVTVIPTHKVHFRYSLFGAFLFTVLTGLARWLFRMYIFTSWSRYNVIYGSLTALIVIMVWVYYFANIFLLSAEVVARLQEHRKN